MGLESSKILDPNEILDKAIDKNLTDFYVGYSGGKDSGIALDIVAKNYPDNFKGVLFINTGIATNATVNFVNDYCKQKSYPLFIIKPEQVTKKNGEIYSYENLVLRYGFPKSAFHTSTMFHLKYFPMRKFVNDRIRDGEKPCIISGVRKFESKRRMQKFNEYLYNDHKLWFCSPIFYKSNDWVMRYFIENDIKRSPVYNTLHLSGDCLCGAFAKKEELKLLQMFHPEVFTEIKRLESMIKKYGTQTAQKYKTWGNHLTATTTEVEQQDTLESFICSDCILDNGLINQDNKKFMDDLNDVEKKIEMITKKKLIAK